jgi:hypothetical protein
MGRKAPRKRLTRRVMACPTGAAAPERLSALCSPRFGVIGAKVAKARAQKTRRGNEEVWVLEIVRRDGRSGICRKTGKYRGRTSQRVPPPRRHHCTLHCPRDTRKHEPCILAKRSQRGFWRNEANGMLTGVRLELARAGRSAAKTRVNALMTRASIFFAKKFLRRGMDCRVKPGNDAIIRSSCPRLSRASTSCFFVRQRRGWHRNSGSPELRIIGCRKSGKPDLR